MIPQCDVCRAFPGTEKREEVAVCLGCAQKLDAMPYDRALELLERHGNVVTRRVS